MKKQYFAENDHISPLPSGTFESMSFRLSGGRWDMFVSLPAYPGSPERRWGVLCLVVPKDFEPKEGKKHLAATKMCVV